MKNGYPNGLASVARVKSYSLGFKNNGIESEVILPVSSEKYGIHPKNTQACGIDENGVHFHYSSGSATRKSNVFKRLVSDIYGYTKTLIYILKKSKKDDVIVAYEGGVLWMGLLALCCHIKQTPIAMELNELPFGMSNETWKCRYKRLLMLNLVFPLYDYFFAISTSLANLAKEYSPKSKIIKVPIIVENKMEGEDWQDAPKYLFHSGTLSEQKDGILGMLQGFGIACQEMPDEDLYYFMTGTLETSPVAKEMLSIIERYKIKERVVFLGFLNATELRKYQKNCILTIINKHKTQQNTYCFSTKLGEYLYFARPVLTTAVGESTNYLIDNNNAYVIPPENNVREIANKIVYAVKHPKENRTIGQKGHELTETVFNCDYQTKRIYNFISNAR